jgi:hypothetical protein
MIVLHGIAFELVNLLVMIFFVLKPNNDVYEEIVKPLLEKVKPKLNLA